MPLPGAQREGIRASVQAARSRTHVTRNGTVLDADPVNRVATVQTDGPDGGPFGADVVAPVTVYPGDRVTVLFTPPHGAMVIGRMAGDRDDWHVIGDPGEPPLGSGWTQGTGTVALGANGAARMMFTREGRRVELRGRMDRASGSNDNIFSLPSGYRPENDLLVPAIGVLGAFTPLGIDMSAGTVSVVAGVDTIIVSTSFLAALPT